MSVAEVMVAAAESLSCVNGQLNAIVGEPFSPALAGSDDGPFAGVPFAIKDLLCEAEGVPQSAGSRLLDGRVASRDSDLMATWRQAGLRTMCRTTTPELGASIATESALTGITRNPWDTRLTPGGSSGGSAALVAAGALPVAHANDAAGSIRIPAALCGLVGLKPTRGRHPAGPDSDEPMNGLTCEFVVCRTVRDAAGLLDVLCADRQGERYPVIVPSELFTASIAPGDGPALTVALQTQPAGGGRVDPRCTREVERVASVLADLGHRVVPAAPPIDAELILAINERLWPASLAETVRAVGGFERADLPELLEPWTARMVDDGRELRWSLVYEARGWQNQVARATARFFDEYDLLLSPTVARPAWPVGELSARGSVAGTREWLSTLFEYAPFTSLANVTGRPAISVPTGMVDGLPVGVQLVGRPAGEAVLLRLAAQLERALPWDARRPPVHVATQGHRHKGRS